MRKNVGEKIGKNCLTEMAERALIEAVERVKEEHRRSGEPMAIWRDGRVVFIHPDEAEPTGTQVRESHPRYGARHNKRTTR